MIQHIAIFLSTILIVITAQTCCPSSAGGLSNKRSINILIPIPYHSPFSGLSGSRGTLDSFGGGMGNLGFGLGSGLGSGLGNFGGGWGSGLGNFGGGLGAFQNPFYFGYFTRYLGRANANGMCPAGVNVNGRCWYDSIGNNK
ncbi:unnamed protein product [Wuchereria bancrofti]|uniref:Uncharacterized protein n=2 Tax=Wuchereria bancrofti TaxID=6293 RepID=A0A3P7DGE9_WUCBA|nr:unnamed protein product [Wuchereria bancrofti]